MLPRILLSLASMFLLVQCATGPSEWRYAYVNGRTAIQIGDQAVPPANIPETVMRAVAAGNNIRTKPYIWGGGHRHGEDQGYDCSGSVSYVLMNAGLLRSPGTSSEFRHYGASGVGDWITVYAKNGHTFIVVAGLRLDTSTKNGKGPRWTQAPRSIRGYRARHPPGL